MKVWLIEYSNYTPVVCADEKSVRAHLKNLGLSDKEIEKALLVGIHIEDDEKYDIGETWIKVWPYRDVIQYDANESRSRHGRMLREGLRANAESRANKEKEVMERAMAVAKALNGLKKDGYKFIGVDNVEELADALIHKSYGSTLWSNGSDFDADINDKETLAAVRELRKNGFITVVDELHSEKRNEAYIRFNKSCFTDEETFKKLMDFLS